MNKPNYETLGTFTPDNLVIGGPIKTGTVTLLSGQVRSRGDVLGIITASGKAKWSDSTDSDGSEAVNCILVDDADATAGDLTDVPVYLGGDFNANQLNFDPGGAHTAANTREAFRSLGIFVIDCEAV